MCMNCVLLFFVVFFYNLGLQVFLWSRTRFWKASWASLSWEWPAWWTAPSRVPWRTLRGSSSATHRTARLGLSRICLTTGVRYLSLQICCWINEIVTSSHLFVPTRVWNYAHEVFVTPPRLLTLHSTHFTFVSADAKTHNALTRCLKSSTILQNVDDESCFMTLCMVWIHCDPHWPSAPSPASCIVPTWALPYPYPWHGWCAVSHNALSSLDSSDCGCPGGQGPSADYHEAADWIVFLIPGGRPLQEHPYLGVWLPSAG